MAVDPQGIYTRPEDLAAVWPRACDVALDAVEVLQNSAVVMACEHVLGGAYGIACAQHPQAGLFCLAPAECILFRHSGMVHDPEQVCDACGNVVDVHSSGAALLLSMPRGLDVRNPAGESRRVHDLIIMGLGICATCDAEARREAEN